VGTSNRGLLCYEAEVTSCDVGLVAVKQPFHGGGGGFANPGGFLFRKGRGVGGMWALEKGSHLFRGGGGITQPQGLFYVAVLKIRPLADTFSSLWNECKQLPVRPSSRP